LAPKICASIAPDSSLSLRDQARTALSSGADFVEIRFDFLRPEALEAAVGSAKELKDKAVFTIRSTREGGKFKGSEEDRLQWLRRLAEQKPMFVDVELDTLKKDDDLADYLERQKTRILVSWHDFDGTPPSSEMVDSLSEMRIYSNYVKLVTTAKSVHDSLRLLELYENTAGLYPIIFGMGDQGILSRVLCTIVGNAPFTYASVDTALVPGQLTVQQMRKLYGRMDDIRA
jgi:3-dehydroquinate dehydratase-1